MMSEGGFARLTMPSGIGRSGLPMKSDDKRREKWRM